MAGEDLCEYIWNHLSGVQQALSSLNTQGTFLGPSGNISDNINNQDNGRFLFGFQFFFIMMLAIFILPMMRPNRSNTDEKRRGSFAGPGNSSRRNEFDE